MLGNRLVKVSIVLFFSYRSLASGRWRWFEGLLTRITKGRMMVKVYTIVRMVECKHEFNDENRKNQEPGSQSQVRRSWIKECKEPTNA